jgi:hypothetical protein
VVFERKDGVIECFDSLGYAPDSELGFIPRDFQRESRQDHTYTLRLLQGSGKKLEYNEVPLQADESGVSTCGRWVVFRVANRDKTVKQFQTMVKRKKIDDAAVAKIVPNHP